MTLEEYINNPMGSAVIANQREMYKVYYTQKYDVLMVRENGKMVYKLYKAKKDDVYAIHLKIPSESIPDFYYDVVIEFTSKTGNKFTSLEKYNIRVYSNDPSFVYTFAYAFNKDKMFITELSDKMSKEALKTQAKERNPKALIGYVKTLYFAYIFMKRSGVINKLRFAGAEELNYKKLSKEIMGADEKISLRQEENTKKGKSRRALKSAVKEVSREQRNKNVFTKTAHVIKAGTASKMAKTTSKTKTVKKTK